MTKVVFYQNRWGWERISYSWDVLTFSRHCLIMLKSLICSSTDGS